jgi:hypothetical protein
MVVMLSARYMTVGGQKYILAFRSVPMTTMMTSRRVAFLRSYGDMIFLLLYIPLTTCIAAVFSFLINTTTTITLIGFFANI